MKKAKVKTKKNSNPKYDSPYKQMFSNLTILRQLLETFVPQDFVKDIDFDSFNMEEKSFTSKKYKDTESDLIVSFKLKNNPVKEIYLYILLEFQSSVDKFMSIRMLNYITNFYIYLMDSSRKDKNISHLMPPVFPIMLYNGDNKWTAKEEISEVIENNHLLGDYGINFKYMKIAENEFSKESLEKIKNIVSTLFLFEAKESNLDYDLLRQELKSLFAIESDKVAVSLLTNYFKNILSGDKIDSRYNLLDVIYENENQVDSMFATLVKKERKQLFDNGLIQGEVIGIQKGEVIGIQKGEVIGIQKGKLEGEVIARKNLLIMLLIKKLGSIPKEIEQQILNCNNIEILDKIANLIFDINNYKEVEAILN